MSMYLRCSCGSKSRVRKEKAGRRGRCPSCGNKFRLPSAEFITTHDGQTIGVDELPGSESGSPRKPGRRSTPTPRPKPEVSRAEMRVRCRCGYVWPFVFPADRTKILLPCPRDGCTGFAIRAPDSVIVENAGRELDLEEYHQATGYWYAGLVVEGQFEIRSAAAGGMGVVYFADHRGWGVPVAIKSAQRQIVENERRLQRFLREIDAWSNLGSHPNIVQAYYAKTIDDAPRVVVEYVSGGALDQYVHGRLGLEPLLRWGAHICDGMAYAHRQGLVHRDLKPQNVLLADEGVARVTDFGLARLVEEGDDDVGDGDEGDRAVMGPGLTRVGKFVGTAPYAAPEQWLDAHSAGPAADIYSFGVMLYQMATGKLPFRPSHRGETYENLHLSADAPDVLAKRPDLPRPVAEVIHRCLAKRAEDRFASFVEVVSILDDEYYELAGRRLPPPPADEERRRRNLNNRAVTLVDLGRARDALAALNEAIQVDPLFVRARYNRALLRLREDQWSAERAVAEYDDGPPALRHDWQYHYHRGLLHLSATDFGSAERDLAWVIRRRPNDVDALNARGLSLLLGGEAGPAEGCLRRAARLAPGRLDVQQNLAVALHGLGRNADALAIYERVAEAALFGPEDRARYAALLAANGRADEARAQMERAIERAPESELVQRLAAEMALGINEFVPFLEPLPLPSIQAADVLRGQTEQRPKNLRLRVAAELLTDPPLMPAARQARVREFGRGWCPRHLTQDSVGVWDCMRSSLGSLQTGRGLGQAPLWLDVIGVLLLSLAFAGYAGVAVSRGQAGAGEGAVYALTAAAPAAVAAIMLRMGAAWWLAGIPFALVGLSAAAVDLRLYGEGVTGGRAGFVLALAALGFAATWVFQSFVRWYRGLRHRRLSDQVGRGRSRWLYGTPSQEQTILWSTAVIAVPALFVFLCPAIDMLGEQASYGELRLLGGLLLLTSAAGLWQLLHVSTGFFGASALVAMTGLMAGALAAAGVEPGCTLACAATMVLLTVAQWSVYRVTRRLWPHCRECEFVQGRWDSTDALDPLGLARDPVSLLAMPPEGVAPPYAHLSPRDWLRERTPVLRAVGLLGLTAVLALAVIPRVGMPLRLFRAAATGQPVIVDEDAWRMAFRTAAKAEDLTKKLDAYRRYLSMFGDGAYAAKAVAAAWSAVEGTAGAATGSGGRLSAYGTYLSVFPESRYAAEAAASAWQAVADGTEGNLAEPLRVYLTYAAGLLEQARSSKLEDGAWSAVQEVVRATTALGGRLIAYQMYLSALPEGWHAGAAEAAAWQAVKEAVVDVRDSKAELAAYLEYLKMLPGGAHTEEAQKRAWESVHRIALQASNLKGALGAYRTFLAAVNGAKIATEAADAAWQAARAEAGTRTALEDKLSVVAEYLATFPKGAHVQEAQQHAWSLTRQAVAETPDLRRKLDAYEAYLAHTPDAAKAREAKGEAWQTAASAARSTQDLKTRLAAYEAYEAAISTAHRTSTARDELPWLRAQADAAAATEVGERLKAYATYLSACPNGAHAADAVSARDALRQTHEIMRQAGLDRLFLMPNSPTDQYGNPVVTRDGSPTDPNTSLPYEIWLKNPRMEFVLIPPGEFLMGSDLSPEEAVQKYGGEVRRFEREHPQHRVRITKTFYLSKYEVTRGQWCSVMGSSAWFGGLGVQGDARNAATYQGDARKAARYLSWDDCREFVEKLGLRLPTEAEWEYACRAGSRSRYSFGDEEAQLKEYAWYWDDRGEDADEEYEHAVGGKLPNAWGLYDMHGNLSEWCQDWYGEYTSASVTDPTGPPRDSRPRYRVVRGGGFNSGVGYCRSAVRSGDSPDTRRTYWGFRPARSLP